MEEKYFKAGSCWTGDYVPDNVMFTTMVNKWCKEDKKCKAFPPAEQDQYKKYLKTVYIPSLLMSKDKIKLFKEQEEAYLKANGGFERVKPQQRKLFLTKLQFRYNLACAEYKRRVKDGSFKKMVLFPHQLGLEGFSVPKDHALKVALSKPVLCSAEEDAKSFKRQERSQKRYQRNEDSEQDFASTSQVLESEPESDEDDYDFLLGSKGNKSPEGKVRKSILYYNDLKNKIQVRENFQAKLKNLAKSTCSEPKPQERQDKPPERQQNTKERDVSLTSMKASCRKKRRSLPNASTPGWQAGGADPTLVLPDPMPRLKPAKASTFGERLRSPHMDWSYIEDTFTCVEAMLGSTKCPRKGYHHTFCEAVDYMYFI